MQKRILVVAMLLMAILPGGGAKAWSEAPSVRMVLQIDPADLEYLKSMLIEFARKNDLEVEDPGVNMPPKDGRPIVYIILLGEKAGEVIACNIIKRNEVLLMFYAPTGNGSEEKLSGPLIAELRKKWPSIHPYTGL